MRRGSSSNFIDQSVIFVYLNLDFACSPEAIGIVSRVAAHHGDEREREEQEDQNDLATRQPEFSFAICTDSQDVDRAGYH